MIDKKPFLTIGMATYDDFHGVYFTIQALRMYHKEVMGEVEFLVIDNNPKGTHGSELRNFVNWGDNIKYVPEEKWVSTAVRNRIFEEANGDFVMSTDCHVLFEEGSIKKLIDYYKNNFNTNNLHQGPMVYDDFRNYSTHFDPEWRSHMYGTWGTDERASNPDAEPFEIPMQGLGVFSCRKDAWLGFNPLFRGFGGEEGYIHEKFRQNGNKTLCLPFLRWMHRFGRPDGPNYPLTLENKVRNYILGHLELGLDVKPIFEHFSGDMQQQQLDRLFDACNLEIEKQRTEQ